MKKTVFLVLAILLCSVALSSCAQKTISQSESQAIAADNSANKDSVSVKDDVTGGEPNHKITEESEDGGQGTGGDPEDFERYYPDALFDSYILSKIVTWDEIYAAEDALLSENAYFYNEQLPPLYLMIRQLHISKEDFVRVNTETKEINAERNSEQDVYSDAQIELLFGNHDIETIQSTLKLDTTFLYGGKLYTIYELSALDSPQLKEMASKGDLEKYLNNLHVLAENENHASRKLLTDSAAAIKAKLET